QRRKTLSTAGGGFVAFTPDGQTLLTAPHELPQGQRRAFVRWNVQSGEELVTLDGPGPRGLLGGDLSVDGRAVDLVPGDTAEAPLGVYDAVTGKDRFPNQGHDDPISSVAFSPDGRWLASGGLNGRMCLWDLTRRPSRESGWSVRPWSGHTAPVMPVAFSPD